MNIWIAYIGGVFGAMQVLLFLLVLLKWIFSDDNINFGESFKMTMPFWAACLWHVWLGAFLYFTLIAKELPG